MSGKKHGSLLKSFGYAIEGIVNTLKNERNIKIHFFAAILVFLAAILFRLTLPELTLLVFTVALVIFAELMNTAFEAAVDLASPKKNPLAKKAKDAAAGAVLVVAAASVFVGYYLFFSKLEAPLMSLINSSAGIPEYLTLALMSVTGLIIFILKGVFSGNRSMAGFQPDGFGLLAGALAMLIALLSGNILVAFYGLALAVLVAGFAITGEPRSGLRVAAGAVLGVLTAFLLFQIFWH